VRCFIALRTDGTEREALRPWLERARSDGGLAVTPADNLHLTLAFLGAIDGGRVEAAAGAAASGAAAAGPGWRVRWAGHGVFGGRARPRVLWVGVDDAESTLARVHAAVSERLRAEGFEVESRAFRPHLTLARARRPLAGDEAAGVLRLLDSVEVPVPSLVRSVALFQSHLGAGPARHEVVADFPV